VPAAKLTQAWFLFLQINPQFYAFRWITLLLTQEFNFADTIHIWDTLLSDPDGPQVANKTPWFILQGLVFPVRRLKLYLPSAGDLAQNLLCNADSCPKTPIGW
jgi:hypothetical protein